MKTQTKVLNTIRHKNPQGEEILCTFAKVVLVNSIDILPKKGDFTWSNENGYEINKSNLTKEQIIKNDIFYVHVFLVSETEEILENDKMFCLEEYDSAICIKNKQILANETTLTEKHFNAIKAGKIKNGDIVLIESNGDFIKYDNYNKITLYKDSALLHENILTSKSKIDGVDKYVEQWAKDNNIFHVYMLNKELFNTLFKAGIEYGKK